MPRITKKECWDILEDRLLTISETRIGKHVGEAKLAVSVLVSAGRDDDVNWFESQTFEFYCRLAALHTKPTRELLTRATNYLESGGRSNFRQMILEA